MNYTDLFMGAVAATSEGNIVFTCTATNRTTPGFFSVRGVIDVGRGAWSPKGRGGTKQDPLLLFDGATMTMFGIHRNRTGMIALSVLGISLRTHPH